MPFNFDNATQKDYIKMLAECVKENINPNYFARYALTKDIKDPFSLPRDDISNADIEDAIPKLVGFWNKIKNNPKYTTILQQLLNENNKAKSVLLDPPARESQRKSVEAEYDKHHKGKSNETQISGVKKIYGIDLGMTYSCIAHINENGEPEVIPNAEGDLTTLSVVFFASLENVVVGKVAKQYAELEPDRVADYVKRSIGDEYFSWEVDGRLYRAEEISAFIIKKLVQDVSEYLGEPITDVVITCPAYFGIKEREATKNAGEIAGLNVHSVLNEPTAAAFNYGLDRAEQDQVVLVYDLGGGTFDVTMIEIKEGDKGKDVAVITTGGDHHLGGKDWDDRIIEHFATEFMNDHGEDQDPRDDRYTMQDLRNKAEEAKKILTAKEKYKTVVSYEGERTEIELTREKFEELTKDLIDRTITLTKNILEEAKGKGYSQVNQMLLVGGATRMPMIASAIKSELGMEPVVFEPELAVAKGAALIALKKFVGNDEIIEKEAEYSSFIKVGIFKDGNLGFDSPASTIFFDEAIKEVFLELLPEAVEVNSVGEEYIQIPEVRCPCGGVYWPKMVFMAIRKGTSYFDLMVTKCIICDERKYFLFDITSFYSIKEEDMNKHFRKKEALNTLAFHILTEFITGRGMCDEGHAEAYFALRERYEVAGIAREAFREDEKLERKLREKAGYNKGLAMKK